MRTFGTFTYRSVRAFSSTAKHSKLQQQCPRSWGRVSKESHRGMASKATDEKEWSEKYTAPFPEQKQTPHEPGEEKKMDPQPDFGAESYKGSGKLKGKVALVTGSDSGIGRAIALAFAREGADVAIAYWKEHDDAKETAHWIETAGVKHILLPGDLADEKVAQEWFDKTVKELGRIDILVNNASTQEQSLQTFTEISRERLERTFMVNIIGMFSLAQKVVKHLVDRGSKGNIINIASIQAYKPSPGILDYSCTKAAIVNLTKGVALETAEKGIRCNCIAPGPVWTPLVTTSFDPEKTTSLGEGQCPLNRAAQPREFMATAVYLATDEDSSYVTGSVSNLSGGNPHIA